MTAWMPDKADGSIVLAYLQGERYFLGDFVADRGQGVNNGISSCFY